MATVTLAKQDLISLHDILAEFEYDKADFNFKFAVSRNLTLLEEMVREIQKRFQASPEYKEYFAQLQDLKKEFAKSEGDIPAAKKDKAGIMYYHIPSSILSDPESEYNVRLKALDEKYADAIKISAEQEEVFKVFMSTPEEFELIDIPMTIVPKEIKQSHFNVLFKLFNYGDNTESSSTGEHK